MALWVPKNCCNKPWQDCPGQSKCLVCEGQCDHYVVTGCEQCSNLPTNIEPYFCDYATCIEASKAECLPDGYCADNPYEVICGGCKGRCIGFKKPFNPTTMNARMVSRRNDEYWTTSIALYDGIGPSFKYVETIPPTCTEGFSQRSKWYTEYVELFERNPEDLPWWRGVTDPVLQPTICGFNNNLCNEIERENTSKWRSCTFSQYKLAPNNWLPSPQDIAQYEDAGVDFTSAYNPDINAVPYSALDFNYRWGIMVTASALDTLGTFEVQVTLALARQSFYEYWDWGECIIGRPPPQADLYLKSVQAYYRLRDRRTFTVQSGLGGTRTTGEESEWNYCYKEGGKIFWSTSMSTEPVYRTGGPVNVFTGEIF